MGILQAHMGSMGMCTCFCDCYVHVYVGLLSIKNMNQFSLLKFKCADPITVALHTFIQATSTEISNIQPLGEECL